MNGYIGTRSRQRRRRKIYYTILLVVILLFIYFIYIDDDQKTRTNNTTFSNDNIKSEKTFISSKEYELRIFEKDQKIIFKDNQINSLIKKNKLLSESIDSLNSEIEKNLIDVKEMVKKEVDETNVNNQKLKKELQKLNSSIFELKKDYKAVSSEYLKINLEKEKSEEKILLLEHLIIEQKKIIEELKGIIHH